MKFLVATLLSLFLFSCGHELSDIPTPPISIESAKENITKTRESIDSSLDNNKKIQEKIKSQERTITSQKLEIREALIRAEKIKEKVERLEQISKEDTFILAEQLKKVEERNMFLELETLDLGNINSQQLKDLEKAKKESENALEKVILKDNEVKELRQQNTNLTSNLQLKNKEVLKLNKELSNAKVYKNWVIGLAVAIVLFLAVKLILSYYKPF